MPLNNATLAEIQSSFKDLMLDNPEALDNPPAFIKENFAEGDISLSNRLKIYRNNIVGSLTDVMKATFPTIETLVGAEFFEGCARTFILQDPPDQGVLTWYGDGFDVFLKDFEPARSVPYLPDIARLEIALNAAYYAKDDSFLKTEDLSAIQPEQLADTVFSLRDSVHPVSSKFPIDQIRDFCFANNENKQPPDMNNGSVNLLIYRPQLETHIIVLKSDEFLMLQNLKDKKSLGEAIKDTFTQYPEFDFQDFLEKFISLETFRTFYPNT